MGSRHRVSLAPWVRDGPWRSRGVGNSGLSVGTRCTRLACNDGLQMPEGFRGTMSD